MKARKTLPLQFRDRRNNQTTRFMVNQSPRLGRKKGLPPGSVLYTGQAGKNPPRFVWYGLGPNPIPTLQSFSPGEVFQKTKEGHPSWIRVTGLAEPGPVVELVSHFNLHPLLIEDIFNTQAIPKTDSDSKFFFLAMKALKSNSHQEPEMNQVCFLLLRDILISFEEYPCEGFEQVVRFLEADTGKVRERGLSYLLYLLMDGVVDGYYPFIDAAEQGMEELEELLLRKNKTQLVSKILAKRKAQGILRKSANPLLEEIRKINRNEHPLIDRETEIYFRDVYEHLVQISFSIEAMRESIHALMELYLARNGLEMNEVMKRLTVVSTLFIPLTFLVGLWGMNFRNMPELNWDYGYLFSWLILILTAGFTVFYLLRRGWF